MAFSFSDAVVVQKSDPTCADIKPDMTAASKAPVALANPFLMAGKMKLPQAKINRITNSIARYQVDDMRPFSTTESKTFRAMITECEQRYKFPSRTTFSETVIPNMYKSVVTRVREEIGQAESVAWTTDSWTSRATQSYVTITAHFVNQQFELCSRVLQTRDLPEAHTGENVGHLLQDAALEWGCKVSVITTDNAANMKIAAKTADIPIHLGCFAHTLNLASGKVLDLREVSNMLGKMRSVVGYLHRSTTAASLFSKKQSMLQLPCHKLIIDVRTRWNSSFLMVERFMEQQVAIIATLSDESIKKQSEVKSHVASSLLEQGEVKLCESFLSFMQPLYHATLAMSPDQKPTVGVVLPLLVKLKSHYDPKETDSTVERKIRKAVRDNLETRYNDRAIVEFLEEASAFDVRFKHKLLDDVWGRLARKMTTDYPVEVKQENTAEQPNVQELPELPNLPSTSDAGKLEAKTDSPPKKKSALSFLFDEDIEICKVEPATPLSERISKEIDLYKKESRLPPTADPLMFWKKNSEKYPLLTRFAKVYLCVQATFVASERIFSTAGDIVTATRSCLDLIMLIV